MNPNSKAIDREVEIWIVDDGENRRIGKGSAGWSENIHIYKSPTEVILKKEGCANIQHRLRFKTSWVHGVIGALGLAAGYGTSINKTEDNNIDGLHVSTTYKLIGSGLMILGLIPLLYPYVFEPTHWYDFKCSRTE